MKVYLIESNINGICTYKIGKTSRSGQTRLSELSTGNAGQMRLVCEFESENANLLEKALHSYYNKNRLSGEWFEDSITQDDFLKTCESIDKTVKLLKEMGNPFI